MLTSLTKAQKKAARTLIDLALERECAKLIRKVSNLSAKPLDDVEKPNHSRYIELFKAIDSFDKRLQHRYDGITGGHYLEIVSCLFAEEILYLRSLLEENGIEYDFEAFQRMAGGG